MERRGPDGPIDQRRAQCTRGSGHLPPPEGRATIAAASPWRTTRHPEEGLRRAHESSSVPRRGHRERRGHRPPGPQCRTPRRVAGPCASSPRPTSRSWTRCGPPRISPRNHAYLVYDTLFGTDEKLQVKPQMVDKHTVSRDGMKYTFTLRDGLKWHDGQPVVAEDCAESLKRWMREGPLWPAAGRPHRQGRARGPQDVHARAGRALRPRAGGDRQAVEQRPVHDAGPYREHLRRRADQGDRGVGAVPLREGRVAAGQPGRVREARRLRAAQRGAERDRPGARRSISTRSVWALHPRPGDRRRRAGGGRGGLVEIPPIDFVPKIEQNANLATVSPAPIPSAPRAGCARTTCIRRSTTRRPGRRWSP